MMWKILVNCCLPGDANPTLMVQRLPARCRGGGDGRPAGALSMNMAILNIIIASAFFLQGVLDVFRVFKLARILKLARCLVDLIVDQFIVMIITKGTLAGCSL